MLICFAFHFAFHLALVLLCILVCILFCIQLCILFCIQLCIQLCIYLCLDFVLHLNCFVYTASFILLKLLIYLLLLFCLCCLFILFQYNKGLSRTINCLDWSLNAQISELEERMNIRFFIYCTTTTPRDHEAKGSRVQQTMK